MDRKLPKTKRGANRIGNALYNKWRKALKGGLDFGMDWPTIHAIFPEDYSYIQAIRAIYPNLPD